MEVPEISDPVSWLSYDYLQASYLYEDARHRILGDAHALWILGSKQLFGNFFARGDYRLYRGSNVDGGPFFPEFDQEAHYFTGQLGHFFPIQPNLHFVVQTGASYFTDEISGHGLSFDNEGWRHEVEAGIRWGLNELLEFDANARRVYVFDSESDAWHYNGGLLYKITPGLGLRGYTSYSRNPKVWTYGLGLRAIF